MIFRDWPFHIGATSQPSNPAGLPSVLPMEVTFDEGIGLVTQRAGPQVLSCLDQVYRLGVGFGTPLSDNPAARSYAEDFLSFCAPDLRLNHKRTRGLEIGAGTGYLTFRLQEIGLEMTALEPGKGFEEDWKRFGVSVFDAFFPTPLAPPSFNNIFVYGVLEHVADPLAFLINVRHHLDSAGVAFFSVPDCTTELATGDPTTLVHEHFSYFEIGSLRRLFNQAGMSAAISKSRFGRTLFVSATLEPNNSIKGANEVSIDVLRDFPAKAQENYHRVKGRIEDMANSGEVGLYAPVRGLPYLSTIVSIELFDDDARLVGKFLPPTTSPIQHPQDLLRSRPDSLVLCSRTFDDAIREKVKVLGYSGHVVSLHDL